MLGYGVIDGESRWGWSAECSVGRQIPRSNV